MGMTRLRTILIPPLLLLLAMLACDFPSRAGDHSQATQTMQALATRVAQEQEVGGAADAEDSSPAAGDEAAESAATASPTPCVPSVSVSVDTNCRVGPGEPYAYLGALIVGEEAQVVGQSSVPNFMIIDNPDNPGEQCWLWDMYAQVTCDISSLPVMEPPPLLPDWNGTWMCWAEDSPYFGPSPFPVTVVHSGDHMTVYANVNDEECVYDVTLDEVYMSARGTCPNPSYITDWHLFWDFLDNWNQLRGSAGGNVEPWCCARNGYPKPEPCENY